ncbi:MAG: HAMP domain-containing histidine kinase [Alphaproteobacteria bacterium]|nr:HAMP domain-containing histidine kinase [Alphaproteobacteria bacterium]
MSSMIRADVPPRIWQTATFRLAVILSLIFGLGSAAVLLALDFSMARAAQSELEDSLENQMAIMRADIDAEGSDALIEMLEGHRKGGSPTQYAYLVHTPDGGRYVAGLPADLPESDGFSRVSVHPATPRGGETTIDMLVLSARGSDGTFLAVGRETSALDKLRDSLHLIALVGGGGLAVLAVATGLVLGYVLLRRLERVSDVAARVLGGNQNERLPAIGLGREFDALVLNLNRMLDRLAQTMSALRQVSGDIAHDLRTPLTRLRSLLEDAAGSDDAVRREVLERAVGETDEILLIFNALLRIAQVEGGDRRSHFELVDISALVTELADVYRPEAEDLQHALRLDAQAGLYGRGDRRLLRQLLSNLLENAMRHTPPGTAITLRATGEDTRIRLSVTDNGPGVPAAEVPNLTQRFYRLDRSRSTPGSGLGLTLATAIAELHDGRLSVENGEPGLIVTFAFPRAPAPAATAGRAEPSVTVA